MEWSAPLNCDATKKRQIYIKMRFLSVWKSNIIYKKNSSVWRIPWWLRVLESSRRSQWGMWVLARTWPVSLRQATLCLLLSLLCVDPPEQRREKSRKMPSCSSSESREPVMWSVMASGLEDGLGPELVSCASTREDEGESDTSEPLHCVSDSHGEGSGRRQGEWCWGGAGRSAARGRALRLDDTMSERAAEAVELWEWLLRLAELVWLEPPAAPMADLAMEPFSSKQEVISEAECRLTLMLLPVEESWSYSTTGVSMGTL